MGQQGSLPSGGSKGESNLFPCLFQPLEAAYISWLRALHHSDFCFHYHIFFHTAYIVTSPQILTLLSLVRMLLITFSLSG